MKFVNNLATGSKIIRDNFPEFAKSNLVGDDTGWDNYAIIVDEKYLFRFPRSQESLEQIEKETEVLSQLHSKLPKHIEVPKYLAINLDADYPFVYYKMIQGKPLTKTLYNGFSHTEKENFTQNIVEFLHILHGIDINKCKSLEKINALEKYQNLYQQVTEKCFSYLTPEEQTKTQKFFEDYLQNPSMRNYVPTVVHGDLSENHILITETGIGIIDFGDTDIFDPAIDLCWLYLLDKKMFRSIVSKYFVKENTDFIDRISQFYVPAIPYYGVIFGTISNNQDQLKDELNDLRQNLAQM